MLFPTIDFAIFFSIVFVLNWLLTPFPKVWKPFIIVASYVFYSWWDWRFIFLLAASTTITIVGGRLIHRLAAACPRRYALIATVTGLVGLLVWFKYYLFGSITIDNILHGIGVGRPLPLLIVTLPVGISFFTFMGLSYVIDIYRRNLEPAPWIDVAVFLSFFPHLIAGPIVRGSDLLPQIKRSAKRNPQRIDLPTAGFLIMGGLFKKVVLSSYVASAIVDPVFQTPAQLHSAPEVLFAIWGYAVQIYCDFSGYTDIAIGIAMLLGFQFPQNFDAPYTARSLQDFWRRWHMTLSSWLRDYLYIPLGGNRGSQADMYRNIMITMLLGGLWHGANWTFIVWGGYHGLGQCLGHWRRKRRASLGLAAQSSSPSAVAWQRFATFQLVCIGWVFFRSSSVTYAFSMLERLFTGWGQASPLVRLPVVLAVALGIGIQYIPKGAIANVREAFGRLRPSYQGVLFGLTLLLITTLGPVGVAPFIYYQF